MPVYAWLKPQEVADCHLFAPVRHHIEPTAQPPGRTLQLDCNLYLLRMVKTMIAKSFFCSTTWCSNTPVSADSRSPMIAGLRYCKRSACFVLP